MSTIERTIDINRLGTDDLFRVSVQSAAGAILTRPQLERVLQVLYAADAAPALAEIVERGRLTADVGLTPARDEELRLLIRAFAAIAGMGIPPR